MAEVFLARTRSFAGFSRRVAIKRLLPELAGDREYVTMFLDEARVAATLEHPNIAQVFDICRDADGYFMVMEYIDGKNLHAIDEACEDRDQRLPLEHALAIAMGIAGGLHAAHESCDGNGEPLGVVHRDVSPTNVMVTFDGAVKLVDFGIAISEGRSTETRTGILKGRPRYMAPEQILNRNVDRRADVFCLGILLFELTTGTPLLADYNAHESLRRIVRGTLPRASHRVPGYPVALENIVTRALERDRTKRYASAGQMLRALQRFANASSLPMSHYGLAAFLHNLFPVAPSQPKFERARTTRAPLRMPLRPRADTVGTTSWEGVRDVVDPTASHSVSVEIDLGSDHHATAIGRRHRSSASLEALNREAAGLDPGELEALDLEAADIEASAEHERDDLSETSLTISAVTPRPSVGVSERFIAAALTAAIVVLCVSWAVFSAG